VTASPTNLEGQLERLPDRPGVYIFRDAEGQPIYIGKARSLRSRVRSHFHASRSLDARTINMYNRVAAVDYITTGSEVEALILESNLVKEHRPEYNIRLRDDKHFPYLRVDLGQPFPRVEIVRRMKRDGARYFGPYTRSGSLRETMRTLRKVFPYRICTDHRMRTAKRPCLDLQIRRCLGPCAGAVTPEDYRAMMEELCLFLEGRRGDLKSRLEARMAEAAENLRFEQAAEFRDKLKAVHDVTEKQAIISSSQEDQDILGYRTSPESGSAAIAILHVREGKVVDRTGFIVDYAAGQAGPDLIASFLKQHYAHGAPFVPSRIEVPEPLPDDERGPLEEWLTSLKGRRVVVHHPLRGARRRLVELANQNAALIFHEDEFRRKAGAEAAYARAVALGQALGLDRVPQRIEGFDISNIMGDQSVASMVVVEAGQPKKSDYRKFRIKSVTGANDFASMQEALVRRYGSPSGELGGTARGEPGRTTRGEPSRTMDLPLPDLILIDGGLGQLAAAMEGLRRTGHADLPILGLAKARGDKEERVFLPGRKNPIILHASSPATHLLQRVRDEAHRFAVTYHRKLRGKALIASCLDQIAGVGEVRRKRLLKEFDSLEQIATATDEQLREAAGVDARTAAEIRKALALPS